MTTLAANHPASVLDERAEQMTRSISATVPERMATFHAAESLRTYEHAHDVTFAALDNVALTAVSEAYQGYLNRADLVSTLSSCESFIEAVSKLLELK